MNKRQAVLTFFCFLLTAMFLFSTLAFRYNPIPGSGEPESQIKIYYQPATEKLDITNNEFLTGKEEKTTIVTRACRGEYEPFSLLIHSGQTVKDILIEWDEFEGEDDLDSGIMEAFIVKGWYQAGITSKDIRDTSKIVFTQELLIKDDSLVLSDLKKRINYLKVLNGKRENEYLNISGKINNFPDSVQIYDSEELLPFTIDSNSVKQIWFTIKIPENALPGIYSNTINFLSEDNTINSQQIELEVLPFELDSAKLTYGIYYHGLLRKTNDKFSYYKKNREQLITELNDLKEHGIFYPTNYNDYETLERDLKIRKSVGLPDDKIFQVRTNRFSGYPQTGDEIETLLANIHRSKKIVEENGGGELFVYGIDEAIGNSLIKQRPSWKAVRKSGVKMFVAANKDAVNLVGDLLDVAVLFGKLNPKQAEQFHEFGNKVFSYHNPQVGQENPEIYRRNYGLALFKAGYDGAMNYAYLKSYGHIWNDFDDPRQRFRDETFVYPTSNGLISTIQWEGFREGVDDVRYISTLLNKVNKLDQDKIDEVNRWIEQIDPEENLDNIRDEIINKILELEKN